MPVKEICKECVKVFGLDEKRWKSLVAQYLKENGNSPIAVIYGYIGMTEYAMREIYFDYEIDFKIEDLFETNTPLLFINRKQFFTGDTKDKFDKNYSVCYNISPDERRTLTYADFKEIDLGIDQIVKPLKTAQIASEWLEFTMDLYNGVWNDKDLQTAFKRFINAGGFIVTDDNEKVMINLKDILMKPKDVPLVRYIKRLVKND